MTNQTARETKLEKKNLLDQASNEMRLANEDLIIAKAAANKIIGPIDAEIQALADRLGKSVIAPIKGTWFTVNGSVTEVKTRTAKVSVEVFAATAEDAEKLADFDAVEPDFDYTEEDWEMMDSNSKNEASVSAMDHTDDDEERRDEAVFEVVKKTPEYIAAVRTAHTAIKPAAAELKLAVDRAEQASQQHRQAQNDYNKAKWAYDREHPEEEAAKKAAKEARKRGNPPSRPPFESAV